MARSVSPVARHHHPLGKPLSTPCVIEAGPLPSQEDTDMRNTYAVPEHLIDAANQLARASGESAADEGTFGPSRYRIENAPYSVASGQIDLSGPLTEPAWGA